VYRLWLAECNCSTENNSALENKGDLHSNRGLLFMYKYFPFSYPSSVLHPLQPSSKQQSSLPTQSLISPPSHSFKLLSHQTKCTPSSLFPSSPLRRLPSLSPSAIFRHPPPSQQDGSTTVATRIAFTTASSLPTFSTTWAPTPWTLILASLTAVERAMPLLVLNTVANAYVFTQRVQDAS